MLKRLCLAAAISSAFVGLARAQYAYTFTSGSPPIGDGNLYPRSLNPARQTNGGAGPTTYFGAASMGFVNTNGNPAFFDANNLLTRPSRLITGAAFWTDPRLGNFQSDSGPFTIASMGLNVSAIENQDFGFDLAIASVSDELQPYVRFQVQGSAAHVAVGYLYFADAGEAGSEIF